MRCSHYISNCVALLFAALPLLPGCGAGHAEVTSGYLESQAQDRIDAKANAGTPSGTCYKTDDFTCAIEAAVTQKTNGVRGKLPALGYDKDLAFVARQWSQSQATQGGLSHAGFPDAREIAYKQEFGRLGNLEILAENVAYSQVSIRVTADQAEDSDAVAATLVNLWKNSPGHLHNMLGDYQDLGVGVFKSGSTFWATQIFGRR